jgi:release factor glutamine methyltransferase
MSNSGTNSEAGASARIADLLACAAERIGGDSARLDAELLLAHGIGHSRAWIYSHVDEILAVDGLARFESLVAARASGVPIAQLLGRRGFWTLELEVTSDTLIPRPETELLVELALARIPRDRVTRILDLGTGSGAIALAIAAERPLAHVTAVDASQPALSVARRNAEALRLRNIDFAHGDWFAPVEGQRFEAIVGNPPYIAEDDPHLDMGDLRFEPRMALVSGHDGLDAIRHIAQAAPAHLEHGGWLLLEHGWTQGIAVRDLLVAAGLRYVETQRDLEQRDRVTLGRRMAS